MKLTDLATILGLSENKGIDLDNRIMFSLNTLQVRENQSIVSSPTGRGKTLAAAKRDYAKRIAGQKVQLGLDSTRLYAIPKTIRA